MSDSEVSSAEHLIEPLTRREREILGLLAQGHSGPEIAQQLTLANSSVKWHIQQLYAKLGVNRRQRALIRARALGLLETPGATLKSPPPTAHAPRHNLPMELTRFFGRELEIARLRELLAEYRLVTVTGAGGVGKTRLSLRVAEEVLDDYLDGVWFVELAPLSDPALVAQEVAVALSVREVPGRSIQEALMVFLRERHVLLILDNCEHLLGACARLADSLLRACPRSTILASSREPLGSSGEAVFPAPSLPFPDPGHAISVERLAAFPSVRLFVDRARMAHADYQITPENAASLARVCQRLDGVPLAIEMAAARMNTLTAEQLASRLDDAFRVLTAGRRTALPRQQTLRATLDWSYDLLNAEERLLLQRLSVFAGGCTLEAAEAVCANLRGDAFEASQVLDVLAALVSKSMVIADRRSGDEPRYRLLEFTRQYAREKLQEAGDSEHLHRRHRDYFLTLTEINIPNYYSRDWPSLARKFEAERDNLRLALEWSFSDLTDVEAGPRLVMATWGAFPTHQEAADWFKRAVTLCQSRADVSASLYARVLHDASHLTALNDPETALAMSQQAVEISRRLDPEDKYTLMLSLIGLGWTYMTDLDDVEQALAPYAEAERLFQEMRLAKYRPEQGLPGSGYFPGIRAELANKQGRYHDAKMYASESVRLSEESGVRLDSVRAHRRLGSACLNLGEYDQARDQFLEALHLADQIPLKFDHVGCIRSLGLVDFRQENLDRALEYCREGIRQGAEILDNNIVASCLGLCAGIAAKQGQPARAARLSGSAQALYAKQRRKAWEDSSLDTLLPGRREGPDQAAISEAFAEGQATQADQAAAYALGDAAM